MKGKRALSNRNSTVEKSIRRIISLFVISFCLVFFFFPQCPSECNDDEKENDNIWQIVDPRPIADSIIDIESQPQDTQQQRQDNRFSETPQYILLYINLLRV